MLSQVPQVIKQAHERLIVGRIVASGEKVLSVYEKDVNVVVLGKAGKEVEFGSTLMIAESAQGLIHDWKLSRKAAPAEWRQLQESVQRQNQFDVSTESRRSAPTGDLTQNKDPANWPLKTSLMRPVRVIPGS